jgi:rare lipoprotein A
MKKIIFASYLALLLATLAGCSFAPVTQDGAPSQDVDVSSIPNAVPKVLPRSRYGNPASYVVNGRRYYVLKSAAGYNKTGIASWYGTKFHGQLTSTREVYDMFGMTAASTELPLPTYVRVTNLENGRQIIVKVNDRGPFDKDRILDLSYAAAKKLGYQKKGTALVRVTAINPRQWIAQHQAQPTSTAVTTTHIAHRPHIYLQIGAFADQQNAINLRERIGQYTSSNIIIKQGWSNGHRIYRVQIGPLTGVAENDHVQKVLAEQNLGRAMTVVQ